MNRWNFVGSLALVITLAACPAPGPNDGGNAGDSGQPEVDAGSDAQRCHDRWQLLCNAWATCPINADYFPSLFPSVDDCVATGAAQCEAFSAVANASAPGVTATVDQLHAAFDACTTAMAGREACDLLQTYLFGTNHAVDAACISQDGTLPNGSACTLPNQCQSAYCQIQGGCGTCASQHDVNGSCTVSQDCKLGLGCFNGSCAPYLEADAGCDAFTQCAPALTCVGGHCGPRLLTGAACNVNAPNPCVRGFCVKGKCEDIRTGAPAGGPCGVDLATGLLSACGRDSVCRFTTAAYQGVCVARAQPGDRCFFDQSFQGSQCTIFSQCINGVCSGIGPEPTCGRDGGAAPARRDGGILPPVDAGSALWTAATNELTQICDAIYACPRVQPIADNWFGARASCDPILGAVTALNVSDPFSRFTPTAITACVGARSALTPCEIVDTALGGAPAPAACDIEPGVVAGGRVCANQLDCAAGTRCTNGLLTQTCGICATIQTDGGACGFPEDCAPGLGCAGGHCVPAAGPGATCSAAQPCNRGLVCRLGLCSAPGEVDAGCNPRANECAPGLVCNLTTSICELMRIVGQSDAGTLGPDGGVEGAPCGTFGGGTLDCPHGYACKITDATNNRGNCDTAGTPGTLCDWAGGLTGRGRCSFPAICTDGICTVGDRTYCQ